MLIIDTPFEYIRSGGVIYCTDELGSVVNIIPDVIGKILSGDGGSRINAEYA